MPKFNTGVYCWTNKVDGKVYVGGAYVSLKRRPYDHCRLLRNNNHKNKHFQAAWNKYGEKNFIISILERCCPTKVAKRETHWIRKLHATNPDFGYNICPTGGSMLGYKHTSHSCCRMSDSHTGVPLSESTRVNMSLTRKGKKFSRKHRRAISIGKTGVKFSNTHRNNLSKSHKGKPSSRFLHLVGQVFGELTVVSLSHRENGHTYWNCTCTCGDETIATTNNLRMGRHSSCGCGHGLSRTPEYQIWYNLKLKLGLISGYEASELTNFYPDWANCFEKFLEDIGSRPPQAYSIAMIDDSLGYVPGNIKWITKLEVRRKRKDAVLIKLDNGEELRTWEYAERLGVTVKRAWAIAKNLGILGASYGSK